MDPKLLEELHRTGQPATLAKIPKLIRGLLYSDPGQGKTTLAGKILMALGGDICLISTDSAWSVLTEDPDTAENITKYDFDGLSQIRTIAEAHMEGIEPFCNFKSLLWDTASTGISVVERKLVALKTYDAKHQVDPSVAGWPHYRILEGMVRDTVEILNKTSMHVIYTAHLRDPTENDRAKKRFAIRPKMPEACFNAIAQEVNLLGWLYQEKAGDKKRKIQLEGTLQETAKSQIPTIPQATYNTEEIPDLVKKWALG
jgi:hypothetical protein